MQVTANVIMFLAVNIAGVYIHDRNDHAQRKAFLDTRNCITARLEMEDENEKMVISLGAIHDCQCLKKCANHTLLE